jgi:hypothetical protein
MSTTRKPKDADAVFWREVAKVHANLMKAYPNSNYACHIENREVRFMSGCILFSYEFNPATGRLELPKRPKKKLATTPETKEGI